MSKIPYDIFQRNLSTYDRNSELTPEEITTLFSFPVGDFRTRAPRLKRSQPSIGRLIQPVIDALDMMGVTNTKIRNNVIESLIHGMVYHQCTYWG